MLAVTAAIFIGCVVTAGVVLWRRRDEIFDGVIPGLVPAVGQPTRTTRVGSPAGAYDGPIAVSFSPPDGVTAGIIGTLTDGRADVRDVTAALLDLAVRGALDIKGIPGSKPGGKPDWELRALNLNGWEAWEEALLHGLFAGRPTVLMSQLTQGRFGQAMREAQIQLYRGVVREGFYRQHPRAKNLRLALVGYAVAVLGLVLLGYLGLRWAAWGSSLGWIGGGLVMAGGVVLAATGRGRTPRTALGTAKRIQALGFKEYLATAETDQIRFDEALDIFSRYLPYAIAFGVTDHWAKVFGEVARRAHRDGVALAWTDVGYLDLTDLIQVGAVLGDAADLAALGVDLTDLTGTFDMPDFSGFDDLGGGFGDLVGGVADFVGSGTDLPLPDGCDGCDLGGCDGCDGCSF